MATRVLAGYTTLVVLLGATVFVAPAWSSFAWAAIGAVSAGAVVLGIHRNAPARRAPWWLFAAAILVMAAGDTVYDTWPGLADLFYFTMFPLVTAGLIQVTRTSVVLRDRARLIDLLTLTCAAALLCWAVLVGPALRSSGLDAGARSTLAAYALGDLLVLITTVRLLLAAGRSPAVILLATGAAGALVSDIVYSLERLGDGWRAGGPGELGYLLFYLCWGAAGLHPSMAALTGPPRDRNGRLRGQSMIIPAVSLAVPPAVLLAEALAGRVADGAVIAAAFLVMSALVITRLGDEIAGHRAVLARERCLREACASLVAAIDLDQVESAARSAVGGLAPAGAAHRVVLTSVPFGVGRATAAQGGVPASADRRARLLPTRLLHPDLRDQVDGYDPVLVCPLLGREVLMVAADERVLATIRDAVEVLAAQITLALDRIALTEAVNRRDSEEYVHAVVQNAADVVLVVDSDDRIRYASPSLTALLGTPAPFATLHDLIDSDQLDRTLAQARVALDEDGTRDLWSLRRADGTPVVVEVSYRDMREDRLVRGFVITMRDVTERRSFEREMLQRALLDSPAGQNRQSAANKFRLP